jgi:hypothetical protein
MRLVLTLLATFLVTAPLRAQTCSQTVGSGAPDAAFDSLFTQNGPGWTGGDSTYSMRLPDGRTVFFFSDSYIASTPLPNGANVDPTTRTRANVLFQAHNSLVVQNLDGTLTTIAGGDPQNPTSLFSPSNTNDVFWMGDSTVIPNGSGGSQLILYLLEFNASSYAFVGTSVATLSLPSLTVQSVQPLATLGTIEWGSSVLQSGGHVFVYGMEDRGAGKYPHVARTTVSGLTEPSTWSFWNGTSWVSDEASSARLIDSPDSISNEFNVNHIHAAGGDGFVMTTMDTSEILYSWKNIVMYFSCSPQGPWSPKQVVYTIPESGQPDQPGAGQLVVYNPHSHLEFTANGAVLISYDINTTQSADLVYADNYRPKFVRVPIAGIQ